MTEQELNEEIDGQKHISLKCTNCGCKFEGLEVATQNVAEYHMMHTGHVVI